MLVLVPNGTIYINLHLTNIDISGAGPQNNLWQLATWEVVKMAYGY
jgi:hypothetical protein